MSQKSDIAQEVGPTYLGEQKVDLEYNPASPNARIKWAMHFIEEYGQIDGAHHKAWVLDQVARILKGSEIQGMGASWSDGTKELRVCAGKESKQYQKWVHFMQVEGEGDYDVGIAP